MSAPRILLTGSDDSRINYYNAIAQAGGLPDSRYCPSVTTDYDGLLLCGGEDIHPSYYGQALAGSRGIDPLRDAAEMPLVKAWLASGKPIMGICRGLQLLNIALGGTLVQHIGDELSLFHVRDEQERDKVHPIRSQPGSVLHRFHGEIFPVNSSHHQVVDRLGEGLAPTAWSETGLVECLEHQSLPIFAVQYHPERMSYGRRRPDTVDAAPLFERFVALCRGDVQGW